MFDEDAILDQRQTLAGQKARILIKALIECVKPSFFTNQMLWDSRSTQLPATDEIWIGATYEHSGLRLDQRFALID
jgi:hypothetical protein